MEGFDLIAKMRGIGIIEVHWNDGENIGMWVARFQNGSTVLHPCLQHILANCRMKE